MTDTIKSVVARESDGNVQITFTIPFEAIKRVQEETLKELAKDVEIPGFRKGNAPLDKVRAKIPQSSLIEHSLSHILPTALADAIKEHSIRIAVYPKYELISADEGKDWQIRAITCELPEINLGDYKTKIPGEIRAISIKKEPTREEKEGVVIKTLLGSVQFAIPKILIEQEVDSRLSNLLARVEKLGLALESYLQSIVTKLPSSCIKRNAPAPMSATSIQASGLVSTRLISHIVHHNGASSGNRTHGLVITNDVLYH